MQTAVPASYCTKIKLASRAVGRRFLESREDNIADALDCSRFCFLRRRLSSVGLRPGSVAPGATMRITSLEGDDDKSMDEVRVGKTAGVVFANVDLKTRWLFGMLKQ